MNYLLGAIGTTKSAHFRKTPVGSSILRHSEEVPNLGSFYRCHFPIAYFFASTDLSPVAETSNKLTGHPNDAASCDEDEPAAACLLFRSRDKGLLAQKQGREANETTESLQT